jgi:hypothetical protein
MKILTVNIIGIPSARSDDLIDANVFQDYDAVVVDPENMERLYDQSRHELYDDYDEGQLNSNKGRILVALNVDRRKQAKGLLQRGGVIVCFMEPMVRSYFKYNIEGEEHFISVTNYDWLIQSSEIEKELGGIKYSKGETVDYIDSGHPFFEYLNIRPSWLAYVDKKACQDWRVLASAFGTNVVSLAKRVGLGQIILLPSYYHHNNGELVEHCIKKLLAGKEITPQPEWAKAILAPGQQELISKITQINEQADALEKERGNIIDANDKLERWKCLLYAKGKHQLEPVVRDALAIVGCNVEPQADKDSDGAVTCDYGIALLEIVGSKRTIKIEKLGELTKNMGNFLAEKGSKVKGILVGNPFCEEPLDNRPPKDTQKALFANELIESAEQQSITVLLSTDLYKVVSRSLSNKFPEVEKQSLRERIFKGKGLVRLL